MKSFGSDVHRCKISVISLVIIWAVSCDVIRCAIHYARWSYSCYSVSRLELFPYLYLHMFSMYQARLTYHLSGAFAGILDIRCMLGELIISDRKVRSLALH